MAERTCPKCGSKGKVVGRRIIGSKYILIIKCTKCSNVWKQAVSTNQKQAVYSAALKQTMSKDDRPSLDKLNREEAYMRQCK